MKLSKLIKKVNKENTPPDGWKASDAIKDIKEETDTIYSTALVYACYSGDPKTVNAHLLEKMFNDLTNLSDEYDFDWEGFIKNKLTKGNYEKKN